MRLFYLAMAILLTICPILLSGQEISPTRPLDSPQFSTLVMLIKAAGLEDIFIGTGPFTVFAPSNQAFEKLGTTQLHDLMKEKNRDRLTDILTYHVVPGKYMSSNLRTQELRTINGKTLQAKVDGDHIKINDATVTKKDMVGPNGVIYEIDTVLSP